MRHLVYVAFVLSAVFGPATAQAAQSAQAGEPVARVLDTEEMFPALFDVVTGIVFARDDAVELPQGDGAALVGDGLQIVLVAEPGEDIDRFFNSASARPPETGEEPFLAMVSVVIDEVLYATLADCGRGDGEDGFLDCVVPGGGLVRLARSEDGQLLTLRIETRASLSDDPLAETGAGTVDVLALPDAAFEAVLPLFTY